MATNQVTGGSFDIRPGDIELNEQGRVVISNPLIADTIKAALQAEKELGEERRRWNILCNINLNICNRN